MNKQAMLTLFWVVILGGSLFGQSPALNSKRPETGISGVYEVVLGVRGEADGQAACRYFAEFGFVVTDSTEVDAIAAKRLYGVQSKLWSYRLQNGKIDSHGLLRILAWESPTGDGVGYAPPETIGQRLSVMMTTDIYRLFDIYTYARQSGQRWLPTVPVSDDIFGLSKAGSNDFFKRPVLVRENAVYGAFFNHVFFQRNGYKIPGYGTINPNANLKTSEFTHHSFIINAKNMSEVAYLVTAFGLSAEKEPNLDGDYQKGAKAVFMMPDGYTHWYQGFVSPNNICGKIKFFIPNSPKPDRSKDQKLGELGITMHTFYSANIDLVYSLVQQHSNLTATAIENNEFGERSFVVRAAEGTTWQILEKLIEPKHKPTTKVEMVYTRD
ncbi:MAG: hypothetical protein RL757_2758 [Bacteroidota bacterium]|jgi:hypothetical protein